MKHRIFQTQITNRATVVIFTAQYHNHFVTELLELLSLYKNFTLRECY